MRLIHIGHLRGGILGRMSVEGSDLNRPYGSPLLWCIPENSRETWIESRYCRIEEHNVLADTPNRIWTLELLPTARLLVVDCKKDLHKLIRPYPHNIGPEPVDWVSVGHEHDAFWLTARGLRLTRIEFPYWDCETVVVLNSAVVRIIDSIPLPDEALARFLL